MDTSRKWIPKRNQQNKVLAVKSQQQRNGTYKADSAQVDWWQGTKEATCNKGLDLQQVAGSVAPFVTLLLLLCRPHVNLLLQPVGSRRYLLLANKFSLCPYVESNFLVCVSYIVDIVKSRTADLLACVLCSLTDTGPERLLYVRSGSIKSLQSCLSGSFHSRGL